MGMVSALAGVQLKTRLSWALAVTAKAQMSTAADMEKCFIPEYLLGAGGELAYSGGWDYGSTGGTLYTKLPYGAAPVTR